MSENNCMFKLGVGKKFDHKEKPQPPQVSSGPPLRWKFKVPFLTHVETFTLILLTSRCSLTFKKTKKTLFYESA